MIVLDMARKINPTIKVVFNNTGVEFPETIRFKEDVSKKVRGLLRNGKTLKLDIGCGLRKKEGYIGIDIIDYSDQYKNGEFIQCDITEGIPLPDNCVEYVYSNRFFEHVPFHYRTKIRKRPYDPLIYILEEIHRVSINKALDKINFLFKMTTSDITNRIKEMIFEEFKNPYPKDIFTWENKEKITLTRGRFNEFIHNIVENTKKKIIKIIDEYE